mgnify:CR=1 FL=1
MILIFGGSYNGKLNFCKEKYMVKDDEIFFCGKDNKDNIEKLKYYDFEVIDPAIGLLACNDNGIGKMPEPNILFEHILKELAFEKTMLGKNVLISAGATCEYIDPVRYITNPSSGKMGFALAKVCMLKGANVTLVCGNTTANPPMFTNIINTISAEDMFLSLIHI